MAEASEASGGEALWFRVLNSSAVVTLITVLVGGIMGQIIVARWQEGAKERERLRLVAEQNLAAGMAQVERAFGQAGGMINAAENLEVIVADSTWNPKIYSDPARAARIETQRQGIVDHFNETISAWQKEREQIALMITYLLGSKDSDPGDAWHLVQAAVDGYLVCVKECYRVGQGRGTPIETECKCGEKKDAAWLALRAFAAGLPKSEALIMH